ncbi:DUF2306 domain-containing protein [Fulvivirga ligni]|uniref:DUF2306 domain-containing protein n=1 Tax=Fulvivirga ligni TaxID=2904246 RepID=UPI001F3C8DC9|nr:DUF2306 domain-containing protein [Fulvivirga ligni]UII19889.1 DUF2306 domain-containing protein [Fulvivirga ligni]
MILITLQYFPLRFDVAFLNIKQEVISHGYYKIAFFSHVYTSIFVLICGIFLFSKSIRRTWPMVHKIGGKVYVLLILLIASPSGLIMAFHANGGFYSQLSFTLQAILWFVFTYLAFKYIKNGEISEHRKFMMRSYALTLSAISLRLFKWIIVTSLALPPMDTYKIVSWAGWVFNILLVEGCFIYEQRKLIFNRQIQ